MAEKKAQSKVSAQRVRQAMQAAAASIRGLTAERLATDLDHFSMGYLGNAARLWQKIRDRDDTINPVAQKRELETALLDWEILPVDDSPEAQIHKEALEDFYNNLKCTHAFDRNTRGGVAQLIRQMMHAVGHKYAVHEIIWRPEVGRLRAEFVFAPLQFFENTTGTLRFLPHEGSGVGEDLEPGGWMVTVHAGLMEASSIAYLFKRQPLQAWLMFCDKFGLPGLHGETPAAQGSAEWDDFRDALANFAQDWALVTSPGGKVNPVQVGAQGIAPHKDMIDRMDRAIARIWRGNDLGTISQEGSATGSNPQQSESEILVAADALIITETLQHHVDAAVIKYRFGTEPKAYFKLNPPVDIDQKLELEIDSKLIAWGVPRGRKDLMEKYGRAEPDAGDILATAASTGMSSFGAPSPYSFANEAASAGREKLFTAEAANRYGPKIAAVLAPLNNRLAQIGEMEDPTQQRHALERLQAALPELYRDAISKVPEAASILEQVIGTAVVSGMAEHAQKTTKTGKTS